ncbi:MAG: sulfotransferase [Phycisphaerae bacterium]
MSNHQNDRPSDTGDNGPPILVTGSHRSGSTWVGRMLSLPRHVGYIHEPFSLKVRPGVCNHGFTNWFQYLCDDNGEPYVEELSRSLRFEYKPLLELRHVRSARDAGRLLRDWAYCSYHSLMGSRPLMKDPIALFSAPWLAKRWRMRVVVVIRHPAAFVGSLKRTGWRFSFENMTRQPLLMRELAEFSEDIERASRENAGVLEEAVLLWRIIHHRINVYRQNHPDWVFVRHEDLSRDPVEQYRRLYDLLDLDFAPRVRRTIRAHSMASEGGKQPGTMSISRDSRANIWSWRKRLSEHEVNRVREGTRDISPMFYGDGDWLPA